MTLKPDEKFVTECIVQFLSGSDNVSWREGEDPPDVYLDIGSQTVALEITQLSPVSFDEDGVIKNRTTEDLFALRLCDELDRKLGDKVAAKCTILLTLYVPVSDARRYRKELFNTVRDIVQSCTQKCKEKCLEVAGEKVRVAVVDERPYSEKKIVGCVFNKDSKADILLNAEVLLFERIAAKQKKCEVLLFDGTKWLALLNEYWLASFETYTKAMERCSVEHDFEKIFVVSGNRQVKEIYTGRSSFATRDTGMKQR